MISKIEHQNGLSHFHIVLSQHHDGDETTYEIGFDYHVGVYLKVYCVGSRYGNVAYHDVELCHNIKDAICRIVDDFGEKELAGKMYKQIVQDQKAAKESDNELLQLMAERIS